MLFMLFVSLSLLIKSSLTCSLLPFPWYTTGFVRFVQAKSAARVMSEYRDNEIVIQDVAVSVKVLKSEGLQ